MVARRHDINANLLFKWKRQEEAGTVDRPLLEGPEFVPIGVVGQAGDGGPALLAKHLLRKGETLGVEVIRPLGSARPQ
ncbi:MAG: transposase [Rhodospirillales bacterium]|nr:transposase [Rhodospirillales bacterium]